MILCEAYTIINNVGPTCMSRLVQRRDITYNIRNDAVVIVPKVHTTSYGMHSFAYYSSHLWNKIPNCVKCIETMSRFKSSIQCCCDTC